MKNCIARINNFPGRASIIKADSIEASKQFDDGSLDFVYLDADHSYAGCMRDLHAWYPKLRVGGAMSGHDFIDGDVHATQFGVKTAVLEFIRELSPTIYVTTEYLKSFWFIKNRGGVI